MTDPEKILLLTKTIQVSATKGQRSKILLDHVQQGLRGRDAKRSIRRIRVPGVVGSFELSLVSSVH